ncbi:MAG: hypothetical protein AAFX54_11245 [Pseudomonadota bacterium]
MKINTMLVLVAFMVSSPVLATQEGALTLNEFRVFSNGIGGSGPIIVEGKRNNEGDFQSVLVTAGSTVIEVPAKLLNRISKHTNGIQISTAGGPPPSGEVYLVFQYGFSALNSTYQRLVLAVKFDGSIRVIEESSFDKLASD